MIEGTGGLTVEAYREAADGYSQSNTDSAPFDAKFTLSAALYLTVYMPASLAVGMLSEYVPCRFSLYCSLPHWTSPLLGRFRLFLNLLIYHRNEQKKY